jgi:hypothetical protein
MSRIAEAGICEEISRIMLSAHGAHDSRRKVFKYR